MLVVPLFRPGVREEYVVRGHRVLRDYVRDGVVGVQPQPPHVRQFAPYGFPVYFVQPPDHPVHAEEVHVRVRRGAREQEPSFSAAHVHFKGAPGVRREVRRGGGRHAAPFDRSSVALRLPEHPAGTSAPAAAGAASRRAGCGSPRRRGFSSQILHSQNLPFGRHRRKGRRGRDEPRRASASEILRFLFSCMLLLSRFALDEHNAPTSEGETQNLGSSPLVFRIFPLHFLLHARVVVAPEARQVAGHLHGTMVRPEDFDHHGHPALRDFRAFLDVIQCPGCAGRCAAAPPRCTSGGSGGRWTARSARGHASPPGRGGGIHLFLERRRHGTVLQIARGHGAAAEHAEHGPAIFLGIGGQAEFRAPRGEAVDPREPLVGGFIPARELDVAVDHLFGQDERDYWSDN